MVLLIILLLMAMLLGICSASYSYDLHALKLFTFRYDPGLQLLCRIILGVALVLICFDGDTALQAGWILTDHVVLAKVFMLVIFCITYLISFVFKIIWDCFFS